MPADWGFGPAPAESGLVCGELPTDEAYVGRPIGTSDLCAQVDVDAVPTAPYLWFDAIGVEPGTVELGDGWVRETTEVGGVVVAVATTDATMRTEVLASVRPGDLCEPALSRVPGPTAGYSDEGRGAFLGARVCAYALRGPAYELVYAEPLSRKEAERTEDAVRTAEGAPEDPCPPSPYEVVLVSAEYEDAFGDEPLVHQDVYQLSCGTVQQQEPFTMDRITDHTITQSTVPWAGPQYRVLLVGPPAPWAYGRFIGIQG